MFHMEQLLVLLLGAAVAPLPCSAEFFSPEMQPLHPVVLGGDVSQETQRLTNLGLEFLLLGDTEKAREAFHSAAQAESISPLTDIGLMLTAESAEERARYRTQLGEDLDESALTPPETFFVNTLLLFARGDVRGAADEFLAHAERYRNDRLSRCWGIVLLHYSSRDTDTQRSCTELSSEFVKQFPDDALVAYTRALCDEFSTSVSEEGLHCAERAAKILPSASTLYGHLLFRAGRYQECAELFHMEQSQAEKNSYAAVAAALYEATALWCADRTDDSLRLRRKLNASMQLTGEPKTKAEILWRWEANFLPLRVMVTRPEKIAYTEIRAAKKAATGQGSPVLIAYRDCLVNLVLARYHAQKGKKGLASRFLEDAEKNLSQMRDQKPSELGLQQTCYRRACEACERGLFYVRAELFKSSSEIWKEKWDESEQFSSLLLPPVLPVRK